MILTERINYVGLAKTGTTTVHNWLKNITQIEYAGKHKKPSLQQITTLKNFIGTIRNPRDWYLSLWSFGCSRGKISGEYSQLTSWHPCKLNQGFNLSASRALTSVFIRFFKGITVDFKAMQDLYSDVESATNFRNWLKIVLDPKYAYLLSGPYNQSGLREITGLYTFNYCKLYCRDINPLIRNKIRGIESLKIWEENECYINDFMKVEELNLDFVHTLEKYGYNLTKQQKDCIQNGNPKNISRSNRNIWYYFDQETIDLVSSKEELIINKFNYSSPDSQS